MDVPPEGGRVLSSALLLLTSTLELKGPVPGGFPSVTIALSHSFMSFVKCHYSPLTTLSKRTLAPVDSAPYPALYQCSSCIIFYMTTHYIFLHGVYSRAENTEVNTMYNNPCFHRVYSQCEGLTMKSAAMSVSEAMPFFGVGLFCAVLISDGFDIY